ncbi:MAG: multiheme c-type cytochrome [Halopseudomonas sp.]
MRLTLLLLLAFTLPACAEQTTTLELLYSGNLDGEIEPCGCSLESDYGGLQRRATVIDQLQASNPELLLISAGGLFSPERGSDQIKHSFILSGVAQLDYDAIGIQWADLAHGEEMLAQSGLPFVVGNWKSDRISRSNSSSRAGDKLFFSQWLDPLSSPYAKMQTLSPITDQAAPLQQAFKQAKQQDKLTVLATTLELAAVQQLFDLQDIDLLLIQAAYEIYGEPQQLGNTLVLQPGSRGQRLGHLKLELDSEQRIASWQHAVLELPDTVANAPQLDSWYAEYNDALRQDYLDRVAQRKALKSGESPYLGEQQCKVCHAAQHQVWSQSEHAKAFTDLEEVGKEFDSHCIGCHTVGFLQPGGYLDQGLTSHLSAVQCENCHGGSREHASSAGQVATQNKALATQEKAAEAICAQCHVREHSPSFDFNTYWPKIAHPGKPVLGNTQ